jgi:hypothetical protein
VLAFGEVKKNAVWKPLHPVQDIKKTLRHFDRVATDQSDFSGYKTN